MSAPSIFGDKPAGLTPFTESGSTGDDFRIAEHVGKTLILTIHGPVEKSTNLYGVKTAISLDAVVLNADGTGTPYKDSLVFNAAPVDQMKGLAGQTIIATVEAYKSKTGTMAPRLAAPDEAAQALAAKYTAANPS